MTPLKTFGAACAVVLLMAGCGSNSGDAPITPPLADPLAGVPASAQADAAGLVAYLKVLADNPSEYREPMSIEAVALVQPDDTEPPALQ